MYSYANQLKVMLTIYSHQLSPLLIVADLVPRTQIRVIFNLRVQKIRSLFFYGFVGLIRIFLSGEICEGRTHIIIFYTYI